jgi:hypothetical protein
MRLVLRNAFVATELSTSIDWPETGFEEIGVTESLFLEADFGPGITSALPVIQGLRCEVEWKVRLFRVSQ